MLRIGSFLIAISSFFVLSQSKEFHRKNTGVVFSAYVKTLENGTRPWYLEETNSYSLNDVITMMAVIAGRFSKVSTYGVGAKDGKKYSSITGMNKVV